MYTTHSKCRKERGENTGNTKKKQNKAVETAVQPSNHIMKHQSFRIVTVYTGYAEFGVENVTTIDAENIEEAVELTVQNNHNALLDDDVDESYVQEFYTGFKKLSTGIYQVNYGEENVQLVIADSQPLYHLVDRSTSEWTNEQWAEWEHMLTS